MLTLLLLAACAHTPVTPEAPAPAIAPHPPGPVLVDQPYLADTILFADELRPVADALATQLEAWGFQVLGPDEQERLVQLASEGRRVSTGEACSIPYVPGDLLRELHPDHESADLRAECDEDGVCHVELVLYPAPQGERDGNYPHWRAPLEGPVTVETVVASIPELERYAPNTMMGGVMGGMGMRATEQGVLVRGVDKQGDWAGTNLGNTLQLMDMDACWADWRRDHWANPVRFEVDAEGKVVRCSPSYVQRLPTPEGVCACDVLASADFGPGAADRRGVFEPFSAHPSLVDAAGKHFGLSAGSAESEEPGFTWADSGLPQRRMAECLLASGEAQAAKLTITYELAPTGEPVSWSADWPDWVNDESLACLDPLLASARFGCSQSGEPGTATVEASIWAG